MKKDPKATAHTLAVVAGAWYILCALLILVSKGTYMGIMSTWFHGIDFNALPQARPEMSSLIMGLITFVGFAWITGYAFAAVYNYFSHT